MKIWLMTIATALALTSSVAAADSYVPEQGIGTVHMAISCKPAAAVPFDRGLALLHNFWYDRALHEFDAAIAADPSCAIAYWGAAMTFNHPLWTPPDSSDIAAARTYVTRAAAATTASDRERRFVSAVGVLYGDGTISGIKQRDVQYRDAMKAIATAYPDDETLLFTALAILGASPSAVTMQGRHAAHEEAAQLAEAVHARQPNHPGALHYLIHAYDENTMFARGLPAARAYAASAPAVPHALHMPSHIFDALGMWKESEASNVASWKASADSVAAAHEDPANRDFHNLQYLELAELQLGRFSAARGDVEIVLAQNDANRKRIAAGGLSADDAQAYRSLDLKAALMASAYMVATGDYSVEDRLPAAPYSGARVEPLVLNARAFTAVARRNRASLDTAAARARALLADIAADRSPGAEQSRVVLHEVVALAARASGATDVAATEIAAAIAAENAEPNLAVLVAPMPAHQLAAQWLLEDKQYAAASRAYGETLQLYPHRAAALLGAARAASGTGDPARARELATEFVALWDRADPGRNELSEARTIADRGAVSAAPTSSPAASGALDPGATTSIPVQGRAGGAIHVRAVEDGAKLHVVLRDPAGRELNDLASKVEPKRATLTATFATPVDGRYALELRNAAVTRGTYEVRIDQLSPEAYALQQQHQRDVRARVEAFVNDPPPGLSLYERLSAVRDIDPTLMSRIGEQDSALASFAWMQGQWSSRAHVFATPTTADRPWKPVHDENYSIDGNVVYVGEIPGERGVAIVYEPIGGSWYTFRHSPNPGVMQSNGWHDNAIVFEGDMTIAGFRTHMRQTITKGDERHFHTLNEERMADGRWIKLDEYEYEKK